MTPCGEDSQRFCTLAPDGQSRSTMRSEGNARPIPRPRDWFPGWLPRSQRQRRGSERVPQLRVGHAPREVRSWHQGADRERHWFRSLAIATVLTRDADAPWIRHLPDLRAPMVGAQPLLRYLRAWPGKA
jgi:hypothetical protein